MVNECHTLYIRVSFNMIKDLNNNEKEHKCTCRNMKNIILGVCVCGKGCFNSDTNLGPERKH